MPRAPCSLPLLFVGAVVAVSATFSNNFNFSVGFWFVAGPVSFWLIALLYKRQRKGAGPAASEINVAALYARAGVILLAAVALIVLLAVDAPVGVALGLVGVGMRVGSKYLAGWALAFAVMAGLARYAVFNHLVGQAPQHGVMTPLAFGVTGLAMIGAGLAARRQEARWAADDLAVPPRSG